MALSNPVDGLRPGMLVEAAEGKKGQILSFDEEQNLFKVCLVSGATIDADPKDLNVPASLKRPGLGGDSDSFDVLIGPRLQQDVLAEEIAACLFEKGFCVMKTCQSEEEVAQAVENVRSMGDSGSLHRLPEEVEEGYLGKNNRGKVAWMSGDMTAVNDPLLAQSDEFLSTIAGLIQPYMCDTLGRSINERTPALVSLSLTDGDEGDYPPNDAADDVLGSFLTTWRRSLLKIVHFMGPGTASVTLDKSSDAAPLPVKLDSVDLECGPNTILLFRTGAFEYSCSNSDENLSLTATFLENAGNFVLTDFDGDIAAIYGGTGPKGPRGDNVEVINLSSRLMCCWDEPEMYRAGLYGGGDAGLEIPKTRWDVMDYYNADVNTLLPWQTSTKHQSIVEGIELFDNKYFEVIASEARVMDPMQRHTLEVGAHNLFKMGITKKDTNRKPLHGGCSVGLDKDDWDSIPDKQVQGGQNVQAIISNRFSFIFNLRGPNFVADTACSASLCATHLAKFTLIDRTIDKVEFHIAIGIHQCLAAFTFIGTSQSHMCSPIGRCMTFNATASGYMRGDGCSGMTLKYGSYPDEREAIWRASQCGQNGRSATLTAPNGLAQEEVIWKAMREASIVPGESCIWNCHGTGTSLGDPIEVGAVRKVQMKDNRETNLIVTSNKTHTGHLEGGAAMTTLLAACLQVKQATATPVLHFNQLNPHLEQWKFSAFFSSEAVTYNYNQGNVHVSSFGFGGTNGHVVFWGENQYEAPDIPSSIMKRISKLGAPEVRVNGNDPSQWEWDGPDHPEDGTKSGDKYKVILNSDDALGRPAIWEKLEDEPEADDGEDDFYAITGPFNEWDADRLEDGAITGLRTITLDMPDSGFLEFRFLKNGSEDDVLFPGVAKCDRMLVPVHESQHSNLDTAFEKSLQKNTWLVSGAPGAQLKIDLFVCRGIKNLSWTFV